jgi:hypothetical protein
MANNDDALSLTMTLIGAQIVDGDAGLVEILKGYSYRDLAMVTLFLTTWTTENLQSQAQEMGLSPTEAWQYLAQYLLSDSAEHGED